MRQRERRSFRCLATAGVFLALAWCPLMARAQQVTFDFVGAPQTWVVPNNVTSVTVDALGAQGGGNGSDPSVQGGKGGRVQTTLAVTPSETLVIYVGGRGGNLMFPNTAGPGGFNGGASGGIDNVDLNGPGPGGGGASDVRQGGDGLAYRVVVAGAGGGAEGYQDANGGDGGGTTGMSGGTSGGGSAPGGGGTQSNGGAGGGGCNGNGSSGSLGQGGVGGNGNRAGGGGGGGYYGGGGGGGCLFGSGGGGGSSYSAGTSTIHTQGYQTDAGQIVITLLFRLQFPLKTASGSFGDPYSWPVTSIFDHNMPLGAFCPDVNNMKELTRVIAFTGEEGVGQEKDGDNDPGLQPWRLRSANKKVCGKGPKLQGYPSGSGGSFFVGPDGQRGTSDDPINYTGDAYLSYDGHPGYDYRADLAPLYAAASGTVVFASGCKIEIDHAANYSTVYDHLSAISVSVGPVTVGQLIGVSGQCGTGSPHLHFGVKVRKSDGTKVEVDPYGWFGQGPDPYGTQSSRLWP